MTAKALLSGVLATACLVFTNCDKDPVAGVTITGGSAKQTVWADDDTGTGDVTFKTTGAWSSAITEGVATRTGFGSQATGVDSDTRATAVWVTISPSGGSTAGDYTVGITLDDNFTGEDRTATITITSGNATISITVTQKATTENGEVPVQEVKVTGVEVQAELSLEPDGKATLTAKVLPENATNKAVEWSSSDDKIATVSASGEVMAIAEGSATITATTDDGGKTATCKVTVSLPIISVTGVTVHPTTLSLEAGKKATITATVLPENATNKAVSWSSDDNEVATVDPKTGEVTAVAVGEASITTTTDDDAKTATCAVTVTTAEIDVLTKIPDPVFIAYCKSKMGIWDTNGNGKLSPAEAAAVTAIDVSGIDIAQGGVVSLEGIEYFTGLTGLYCNFNNISSLDVSKNNALTHLSCNSNKITSLDVSKCTALSILFCADNQLTTLDISKNAVLTELACSSNSLTALDMSGCKSLTYFSCNSTKIASLDLSKNTALTRLYCSYSLLYSLDISKNTALTVLHCSYNPGNGTLFPVTAWFDNDTIPATGFHAKGESWSLNSKTITIDYQKAE